MQYKKTYKNGTRIHRVVSAHALKKALELICLFCARNSLLHAQMFSTSLNFF